MTYTQGPWKIQQTRIDDIAFVSDIHAPHQDNPSENGTDPTIATTWHRPCEGQAEANATLIASAPDLLFCLQTLLREKAEEYGDPNDLDWIRFADCDPSGAWHSAYQAIAKATGAEVAK